MGGNKMNLEEVKKGITLKVVKLGKYDKKVTYKVIKSDNLPEIVGQTYQVSVLERDLENQENMKKALSENIERRLKVWIVDNKPYEGMEFEVNS